ADGFTTAATDPLPSGTAFGAVGAVPRVTGRTTGTATLFVSTARLSRGTAHPPLTAVEIRTERVPEGHRLHVRWPDGGRHTALLATGSVTVHRED
ncbi:hypothetical protein BU198_02405, partial [Streptomyces sp. CBMA156]|nr:hypothetical protein [Streptomyces sp. CBMA156]